MEDKTRWRLTYNTVSCTDGDGEEQREILTIQNELQRSKSLKEEMESNQGEILDLKDKLQGTTTVLLDFQNPSKEKFEERWVSSGTGLINLENSTRCLELRSNFDNTAKRQEKPHNRKQQSRRNRENNYLKE
jgi:hypothetical protein